MRLAKKLLLLCVFNLIILSTIVAAENYNSVPINHRVYTVMQVAEIRGIIPNLSNVRPYSTSFILEQLNIIKNSTDISKSEREIVLSIINELSVVQTDNSASSLLKYGSYRTYSDKYDIEAKMGIGLNFQFAHSLDAQNFYDSRNGGHIYLQGSFSDFASFYMNIGLRFDHLDPRLFLKNDFTIPTQGKYATFWDHQGEHILYYGVYHNPEMAISLFNNIVNIRWASVKRDWGVGHNNLGLSGSANSFNGIELQLNVAPWLRYSFIAGALGKISMKQDFEPSEFYEEYIFSDLLHDTLYENNYSAHRVELKLPWNITFGIYESVVYRKRFEIGYLNPFSILMYEQNIMGDFDNVLAGVDAQWILPHVGRLYGAMATTEMYEINPKRFFIEPRNIMGIQAGVDVIVPSLPFATINFQYTYLGPFFYTHKPLEEYVYDEDENFIEIINHGELSMVNEGRNIGYPLRPNSDEFLLSFNMNFKKGWEGNLDILYQRRSGQYGFNVDKFMRYKAAVKGLYNNKNFNAYLFEKTLGIKATAIKTFTNSPIQIQASYLFSMVSKRNNPTPLRVWDEGLDDSDSAENHDDYYQNPVLEYVVDGPWSTWSIANSLSIGFLIWY